MIMDINLEGAFIVLNRLILFRIVDFLTISTTIIKGIRLKDFNLEKAMLLSICLHLLPTSMLEIKRIPSKSTASLKITMEEGQMLTEILATRLPEVSKAVT